VIYANDAGAIMAVPFDLASHRVTGTPLQTGESTMTDVYSAKATLSAKGDLTFVTGGGPVRPTLVDRSGAKQLMTAERAIVDARYSPDGSRLAFSIRDAGRTDIWVYTLASASLDRLTSAGTLNDRVEWSPDRRVSSSAVIAKVRRVCGGSRLTGARLRSALRRENWRSRFSKAC
jgi:hypothetical protein